jgi:hypothetical protein
VVPACDPFSVTARVTALRTLLLGDPGTCAASLRLPSHASHVTHRTSHVARHTMTHIAGGVQL